MPKIVSAFNSILGVAVARHRHVLLVDEGGSTRATATDLAEERHLGLPNRPPGRGIANGADAVGDPLIQN